MSTITPYRDGFNHPFDLKRKKTGANPIKINMTRGQSIEIDAEDWQMKQYEKTLNHVGGKVVRISTFRSWGQAIIAGAVIDREDHTGVSQDWGGYVSTVDVAALNHKIAEKVSEIIEEIHEFIGLLPYPASTPGIHPRCLFSLEREVINDLPPVRVEIWDR